MQFSHLNVFPVIFILQINCIFYLKLNYSNFKTKIGWYLHKYIQKSFALHFKPKILRWLRMKQTGVSGNSKVNVHHMMMEEQSVKWESEVRTSLKLTKRLRQTLLRGRLATVRKALKSSECCRCDVVMGVLRTKRVRFPVTNPCHSRWPLQEHE